MTSLFPRRLEVSEPSQDPPPITSVFNAATGASASAVDGLGATIDQLVDANIGLDDVVMRATSEIDRLQVILSAAMAQRARNLQVIACLESAAQSAE